MNIPFNHVIEQALSVDAILPKILAFNEYFECPKYADYLSYLLHASPILSKKHHSDPDFQGFFSLPREYAERVLRISADKQNEINKRLLAEGIIVEKKKKMNGLKYYRLNGEKIAEIIQNFSNFPKLSDLMAATYADTLEDPKAMKEMVYGNSTKVKVADGEKVNNSSIQQNAAQEDSICVEGKTEDSHSKNTKSSTISSNTEEEKGQLFEHPAKCGLLRENTKDVGVRSKDSNTSYSRHIASNSQFGFAGKSSCSQETLGEKKETQLLTAKKQKPLPSKAPGDLFSFKGVTKPKVGAVAQRRVRCLPEVYGLILHWNNEHGTVVHKIPPLVKGHVADPTKTVERAIRYLTAALEGTLYSNIPGLSEFNRKFTPDMIRKGIKNHSRACLDKSVLPVNKTAIKAVSLPDFLFNERNVELGMEFSAAMLYYFLKTPIDSKNYVPEIKFTEVEERIYEKGVASLEKKWGGFSHKSLSDSEMKNLRLGVRHASKFLVNRERFYKMPGFVLNENTVFKWYVDQCIKVNGGEFGWEDVGSRLTPTRIIKYLEDEGLYDEGGFFAGLMNIENPALRMALGQARGKIMSEDYYMEWFGSFTTPPPTDPKAKEFFDKCRKDWALEKKRIMEEFAEKKSSKSMGMKRRTASK